MRCRNNPLHKRTSEETETEQESEAVPAQNVALGGLLNAPHSSGGSRMKKLKHSEIPEVRNLLLEYQDGIDPITKLKITDPVLDHQHDGGFVRATLQREVNAFEGKVFNAYKRYIKHLDVSLEETLIGLMDYWKMYFS
jgi:hypothetical protein